jgi:type I restriction enzyme S subunit
MIADLKPYAEYKESGLPWAERVPSHWNFRRTKVLFGERVQKGFPNEPLLAATQSKGVVKKTDYGERTVTASKDFHLLKLVEPGDFVISLRSFQGGLEIAHCRGIISPAYTILKPRDEARRAYFKQFFKSPDFIDSMTLFVTGIREGQNIDYERLSRAYLPVPPVDEQEAIGRFLDHWNGRLEKAIRAKRRVIALLQEQKQAIIHRAVTKGLPAEALAKAGLAPNVKLKDSGIPWLGEIPEHWEVARNMALFSHRVESGVAGLPVLQVSLRSGITMEELDQFGRPKKLIADATKYKRVHQGDMAYNTMRMWQGAVGVSPCDGLVSPAYIVITPRSATLPEFYDYVFHTDLYKQQVNRQSTGIVSDRNRLYWDSFKQMPNLVLPKKEQGEIVDFIRGETDGLNAAIARYEREIALLREYRTRLTADVVTGKLDVRAAAAQLPDPEQAPPEVEVSEDNTELEEVEG